MSDITTKFDKFKRKKIEDFAKNKEFQPLSDDIIALSDTGEYKKIKEPVKIVQVTGVLTDEDEIKKINEISGGPILNTDISLKQVKRGDIIYLTVLLQKPGSAVFTAQTMGVLKVRISDIYFGLNILNTIKK